MNCDNWEMKQRNPNESRAIVMYMHSKIDFNEYWEIASCEMCLMSKVCPALEQDPPINDIKISLTCGLPRFSEILKIQEKQEEKNVPFHDFCKS